MKFSTTLAVTGSALTVAAFAVTGVANAAPASARNGNHAARICSAPAAGQAACLNQVVVDATGKPAVTGTPSGLNPVDIRSAYGPHHRVRRRPHGCDHRRLRRPDR